MTRAERASRPGERAERASRPAPDRPPAAVRRAIAGATVLAVVVFGAVATGGHPSRLLERGPFTADFFDEQAHALLDGHLDVDPAVASIEGFEHDGRTYLYYGLAPAVLRLPAAAVTDDLDGRLGALSMLAALAVACWAAGRLAWLGRVTVRGPSIPLGRGEPLAVAGFVAVVGASSPLLFLASRTLVYHEAELWGAAIALLAAVRIITWWERPGAGTLAAASLAATIAFHTRASVGGGAVVALVLALAAGRRRFRSPSAVALAAAAVALPVLSYAAVNLVRFDTPFSVPFEEQVLSDVDPPRRAALVANDGTLFGAEFVPSAAWAYVRPDGVTLQRLFPWITFRESTTVFGDAVFDVTDRSASLPVAAPALLALAAVGAVAIARRSSWAWRAVAVGGLAGVGPTVAIAFIANRYLSDFVVVLVVLAAPGLWAVAVFLHRHRVVAVGASFGGALALGGLAVNAALAAQAQNLFLIPEPERRADFVELQYRRDGRDVAAEIRVVGDEPGRVRARGAIAVLEGCSGVYWSNGDEWFPLELGAPHRQVLSGDVDGESTVMRGDGWRLTARRAGDDVAVAYATDGADGEVRTSSAFTPPAGDDVALVVDRDLVRSELVVSDGTGDEVLRLWPVPVGGTVTAGASWRPTAVPTPICDDLAPRAGNRPD